MFVVESVVDGARIGLDLADAYAGELLSDVRVGLALGPVLLREGDYFGTTVNLARRIVNMGNPGTVLISENSTAPSSRRLPTSSPPRRSGLGP
jgi:adenylate cyclase